MDSTPMAKPPRTPTSQTIQTQILDRSRRRCTLCYYLHGDMTEKHGQIAHLDKDRINSAEDNLAFMCLEHHTLYDSKTSQHKNYTLEEVKAARTKLYEAITRNEHYVVLPPQQPAGLETDRQTLTNIITLMAQANTGEVLRQHDFGGPFDTAVLDVVSEFLRRSGAQYEFIDQDLEQKRAGFLKACNSFSIDAARYTFSLNNSTMRRVPSDWHTKDPKYHGKVVKDLNDKANTLFIIYEDLVRSARRRLTC